MQRLKTKTRQGLSVCTTGKRQVWHWTAVLIFLAIAQVFEDAESTPHSSHIFLSAMA
jgi:hypothetical protein